MTLQGQVTLITGGARGLGRTLALAFAEHGVHVAILDIDREGLDETARQVCASGARCHAMVVDITDPDATTRAVNETVETFGRLDVLVNNAGVATVQPLLEVTAEQWDRVFDVNVKGTFLMLQAAARHMKTQGGGRIINITSPASRMALTNYTAYSASKAAVDSITRAAAVTLGKFGITVNGVAPGRMDTEMQRMTEAKFAAIVGMTLDDFVDSRTRDIPLQRRATPEEVARAVVWLASSDAAYVTGDRLNISGGLELA